MRSWHQERLLSWVRQHTIVEIGHGLSVLGRFAAARSKEVGIEVFRGRCAAATWMCLWLAEGGEVLRLRAWRDFSSVLFRDFACVSWMFAARFTQVLFLVYSLLLRVKNACWGDDAAPAALLTCNSDLSAGPTLPE